MLVPDLRPLAVGEIIDVAIKLWRRNLAVLARIVLVVVAPVQILSALVAASVGRPDEIFGQTDAAGNPTFDGRALGGFIAGTLTAQVLSMLALLIASAAVLRAVSVAYLGGTPHWRESLRGVTSRLRSLIWLGLLLIMALGPSFLALLVPGVWLVVAWSVSFPVLIAEGERGTAAMRRSFRLVRHRWWPTFGALALAFLFQLVLGAILGIPMGLLTADWDPGSPALIALTSVAGTVSSVITTPFMAAVVVLIYFDLRIRKEGFDLQLLSQGVGVPAGFPLPAGAGAWGPAPGCARGDLAPPPPPGWGHQPTPLVPPTPGWGQAASPPVPPIPGWGQAPAPPVPPFPGRGQPSRHPVWPPQPTDDRAGPPLPPPASGWDQPAASSPGSTQPRVDPDRPAEPVGGAGSGEDPPDAR